MASETDGNDTRSIHARKPAKRIGRAASLLGFQSSLFVCAGQLGDNNLKGIRMNNTLNHEVLH